MNLILTIAWRNIFRHKAKTFVIGTILFLGALIMTIGNGVIEGLDKGLSDNIVNGFSGHLVLASSKQNSDAVLMSQTGQTIEPINNYLEIKHHLEKLDYIKEFLPAGIGYVWVLNENGQPIDQFILGVNFKKYSEFFNNNVTAIEGRLLKENEKAVLVSHTMRKWIFDFCGYWIKPKNTKLNKDNLSKNAKKSKNLQIRDNVVYMGLSRKNSTLDILLDVVGVFKFRAINGILGFYSIVDVESFRECMGFFTSDENSTQISEEQNKLLELGDNNLDTIFSEDFSLVKETSEVLYDSDFFKKVKKKRINTNVDEGVYSVVFIKLKDGNKLDQAYEELNKYLKDNKLNVKAIKWNDAVGFIGQISLIVKIALNTFVWFIFIAAIIIIMNTLSLAAMERISEIGMMRAVGAKKKFIHRMFIAETSLLSMFFGGLGILTGAIIINILATLKLSTENEILQIVYGGNHFNPIFGLSTLQSCLIQLLIVTVLAVIYPLLVARKITPLDAIARD